MTKATGSIQQSQSIHRLHGQEVHHSKKKQRKFRPTYGLAHTVQPVGKQHASLPSIARRPLNLSQNAQFRSQQSKDNASRRISKTRHHLPSIKTVLRYAHSTALHTANSAHLGSIIHRGVTIANRNFDRSFKLLRGIGVVTQGLAFIQQTGKTALQATRDIAAHKERTEAQHLLDDYNPETRTLRNQTNKKGSLRRLKSLLKKDHARLGRTKNQIAFDRLLNIKNIFITAASLVESSLLLAARFSAAISPALPGVGVVVSSMVFIKSAITTGVQISALNNLASASSATQDPLLTALSGHIKQERTIKARQELVNASISALSAAGNIGAAAIGPGALAALIVSGGLGISAAIGSQAYNAYHNRQLTKRRTQQIHLPSNPSTFSALAEKNIGVAERAFLYRLRDSQGDSLKENIKFLSNLGVTDATIKRLQLAPKKVATELLQDILYKDKLAFKGLQLKQTGKTFLHITGISALGRRIKAGGRWLVHKTQNSPSGGKNLTNTATYSPTRQTAPAKPALTTYLTRRYQGYSLLTTS